jgi:hypothetical protein
MHTDSIVAASIGVIKQRLSGRNPLNVPPLFQKPPVRLLASRGASSLLLIRIAAEAKLVTNLAVADRKLSRAGV